MFLKAPLHDLRRANRGLDDRLVVLKMRPLEIALCFLAGDPDRQVAERVGVSITTVRRNIQRLMGHFGCASRTELRARLASGPTFSHHQAGRTETVSRAVLRRTRPSPRPGGSRAR